MQEKTLKDIETWLSEYNVFEFKRIENEDNAFTLKIETKSKAEGVPIYVLGHRDDEQQVMVSWFLHLDDQTKDSLRIVNLETKHKFESVVRFGFQLRNIALAFYDSIEDFNVIYAEKSMILNQLSREKLYYDMMDLKYAMKFIEKKFVEFFKIPITFDPSSNV